MIRVTILLLFMSLAYGQVTFKAYHDNTSDATPGTTIATTGGTFNIATGDTLVACVGRAAFPRTVSLSDGGSNTSWSIVGAVSSSGAGETVGDVDMYVITNAVANAAANITATFNSSTGWRWIGVAQYSGLAAASVTDQSSCSISGCVHSTGTTTHTAVNVTTTQANELLAACYYTNGGPNWTAQNSFNFRSGTTGIGSVLADKTVSSTGSYPSGDVATTNSSVGQVGVFGTFKAAGGSPVVLKRRLAVIQ